MSQKKAKGASGGGADHDRLSALPDALLHKVMSFLRAWEVARTCVLSRRWRNLWASAPCVDLRVCCKALHRPFPSDLAKFAYRFFLEREASAPVDTLRLLSSPDTRDPSPYPYPYASPPKYDDEGEDYCCTDVDIWIRAAINRRARVIQLSHHPRDEAFTSLECVRVISCHLKHLKLSSTILSDNTLCQLSYHLSVPFFGIPGAQGVLPGWPPDIICLPCEFGHGRVQDHEGSHHRCSEPRIAALCYTIPTVLPRSKTWGHWPQALSYLMTPVCMISLKL